MRACWPRPGKRCRDSASGRNHRVNMTPLMRADSALGIHRGAGTRTSEVELERELNDTPAVLPFCGSSRNWHSS